MDLIDLNLQINLIVDNYDKFHEFLLHLGSLFGIDERNASLVERKPDEAWSDYDRLICLLRQIKKLENKHILCLMLPHDCDDEYLEIFYEIPGDIGIRLDKANRFFRDKEASKDMFAHLIRIKELCQMYSAGFHIPAYIQYAFDMNKRLDTKNLKIYIRHICDGIINIILGNLSGIEIDLSEYRTSSKVISDANRAIRYANRYEWMFELAGEIESYVNMGKAVSTNVESRITEETSVLGE